LSDTEQTKQDVRRRLEALATVSKELENNAKMQAAAPNIVAAEQLKKRVTELTELQGRQMNELIAMHPDPAAQERFHQLSQGVDELQLQVKAAQQIDELKRLESEMEARVSAYVLHFQRMVAELMGAPPPETPVYSKK
jgi:hypothetical protein